MNLLFTKKLNLKKNNKCFFYFSFFRGAGGGVTRESELFLQRTQIYFFLLGGVWLE